MREVYFWRGLTAVLLLAFVIIEFAKFREYSAHEQYAKMALEELQEYNKEYNSIQNDLVERIQANGIRIDALRSTLEHCNDCHKHPQDKR
jgi:hypothetical protein